MESLKHDAKDKHIFVAEAEGAVVGSVRFGPWLESVLSGCYP